MFAAQNEQRQHEQHLHRAEQMMAIGQVAAGVAHELRNPLTSIKGLVQVNLRDARAQGLPEEDLAVIEHETARSPETLLESELFGHEKGAFTGADRRRIGKFEQASGGTLFLDEIGDMTPLTQTKILRVLQGQEFQRVGGNEPIKADVRVIAARNRDLEKMVADGTFRGDLYYRLNVDAIRLPPLRERGEDLPLLAEHFVRRYSKTAGMAPDQAKRPPRKR